MIYDGIYYLLISLKQALAVWVIIEGIIYIYNRRIVFQKIAVDFVFIMWFITTLHITGMYNITLSFGENATRMAPKLIPLIGTAGGLDLANILLFLPFGILLPFVIKKITWTYKKIIIAVLPIIITIEVLQYLGGRLFDIDDIISNTLGAVVGYLLQLKYQKEFIKENRL